MSLSPPPIGRVALAAALAWGVTTGALRPLEAQEPDRPVIKEDLTGTNPALFNNVFLVSNEYIDLPGEELPFSNSTRIRYGTRVLGGRVLARLTLPFNVTNRSDDGRTVMGVGDVSLQASWKPYVRPRTTLLVSAELFMPTASSLSPFLGNGANGKWVLAPTGTLVFSLTDRLLFAPSAGIKFSFAGDPGRADVFQTQVDLYLAYRPSSISWIVLDPQALIDHEAGETFTQVKLELGRLISVGVAPTGGPATNGRSATSVYVRPALGLLGNRPIDWGVELGFKIVH